PPGPRPGPTGDSHVMAAGDSQVIAAGIGAPVPFLFINPVFRISTLPTVEEVTWRQPGRDHDEFSGTREPAATTAGFGGPRPSGGPGADGRRSRDVRSGRLRAAHPLDQRVEQAGDGVRVAGGGDELPSTRQRQPHTRAA